MKINSVIVGFGQVAKVRHFEAIQRSANITLRGVVDSKPRQAAFLENQNVMRYDSFEDALDDESINLVIVCVPPYKHFDICKAAILANKNVLCEKPFMVSTEEIETIQRLAEERGVIFHVVQNFYYSDAMRGIRKKIDLGEIGSLEAFKGIQWSNESRRIPVWHDKVEGGLFFDEMPHFLYLAGKLFGQLDPKDCVQSYHNKENDSWSINFANDEICGTVDCWFSAPLSEWFFVIKGSKKLIIYDIYRDIFVTLKNENKRTPSGVFKRSLIFSLKYSMACIVRILKRLMGHRSLFGHDIIYDRLDNAIQSEDLLNTSLKEEAKNCALLLGIIEKSKL